MCQDHFVDASHGDVLVSADGCMLIAVSKYTIDAESILSDRHRVQ